MRKVSLTAPGLDKSINQIIFRLCWTQNIYLDIFRLFQCTLRWKFRLPHVMLPGWFWHNLDGGWWGSRRKESTGWGRRRGKPSRILQSVPCLSHLAQTEKQTRGSDSVIHKLPTTANYRTNISACKVFRVPSRNVQKASVLEALEKPWSAASCRSVWRGRWWLCRWRWPDTPGQTADRGKASRQAASPWGSWWAPSWHGSECEGGAERRAYQAFGSKLGAWVWCK